MLVLFAALILAPPGDALAAKRIKGQDPNDRILKLHRFTRPIFYPLAIPTSNVGVSFGYMYTTLEFEQEEDFFFFEEKRFQFAGLNERINIEGAFGRRFSLEFLMTGAALAGADDDSAMLYGGQVTGAVSLIPKFSLYHSEKRGTSIAVSADINYDTGAQTSPIVLMIRVLDNALELLEESLEEGEFPSEGDIRDITDLNLREATITTERASIRPSLLVAQTISPMIGVSGGLRFDYGLRDKIDAPNEFDIDENDPGNSVFAGAGVEFDFYRVSSVPFGARAEFDYGIYDLEGEELPTLSYGAAFLYTGRSELDLSATIFQTTYDIDDETDGQDIILQLTMRYYFF
ncbi:hypothetical protein K8I61_08150 [bacterium]|nr:hypothetical protein [bacterium]